MFGDIGPVKLLIRTIGKHPHDRQVENKQQEKQQGQKGRHPSEKCDIDQKRWQIQYVDVNCKQEDSHNGLMEQGGVELMVDAQITTRCYSSFNSLKLKPSKRSENKNQTEKKHPRFKRRKVSVSGGLIGKIYKKNEYKIYEITEHLGLIKPFLLTVYATAILLTIQSKAL